MGIKQGVIQILIDELGVATEQRKAWEKTEEVLKKKVADLELSDGTHNGKEFSLAVVTKAARVLDTEAVYKFLGIAQFLLVVKVVKKELVKYMLESDMDQVSIDGKESRAYSTARLTKGG
jgi:hypothetical protein